MGYSVLKFLAGLLVLGTVTSCNAALPSTPADVPESVRQDRYVMGSMAQVEIFGRDTAGLDLVFAAIHECDAQLRMDDPESGAIRDTAIAFSEQMRDISRGAFDARMGRVTRAWMFNTPDPIVPSPSVLRAALRGKHVEWDFGGIGKGMAADQAAAVLKTTGAQSALVNLGGNIRVIGVPPGRTAWRIGVTHPRRTDSAIAYVSLPADAGVATSGDYQRFAVGRDGRHYAHILDPLTGHPADRSESGTRLISVTIVAPDAATADGWSTAAFVQGWPVGFLSVEAAPGLEGLFVSESETGAITVRATSGLEWERGE